MCIFNFTNSSKFNSIIHQHSLKITKKSVVGCIISSTSLAHIAPIKKRYSFVVFYPDKSDIGMYILMSTNRITKGAIYQMLDSFDEFIIRNK